MDYIFLRLCMVMFDEMPDNVYFSFSVNILELIFVEIVRSCTSRFLVVVVRYDQSAV